MKPFRRSSLAKLDSMILLALSCSWLAPAHISPWIKVSAANASTLGTVRERPTARYLRTTPDHAGLIDDPLSRATSLAALSSPSPQRNLEQIQETLDREEAIEILLTRSGYNTAFGEEPLCWESVNASASPYLQTSKIYDADMLFPNPLVQDFAFVPGEELLFPCFEQSKLTVENPIEVLRGERLRTGQWYEYKVNITLDFESIFSLRGATVGDAVVTATPNVSQVALQVMHCVLGKSGVCTPFLHEQAYAKQYLETGIRPSPSAPGSIHGETHTHSKFIKIDLQPKQAILDQSISLPLQVNVEGDYFVIAAAQFYTGDAATNVAIYRWDMANAMSNENRVVSYQHPADIQQVSHEVIILAYTSIAVASLVILFLIYQAIKHREEQVLKLSQGDFLVVFLISALTATVCTFMMEPKNDLYCNLGSTLVMLPVQLMYAITAGRLWRINAVISPLLVEHMRKKTKWTNRFVGAVDALSSSVTLHLRRKPRELRRSIPKWQLAVVVGMFVSPQVLLQIAEYIWQPSKLVIEYNDDMSAGRYICQTESPSFGSSILVYSFLALLILIFIVLCVAYSSRKLPSLFNETRVIYDSTFISVVLILLGFGIVALTDTPTTSPDVQFMVWVVVTLSITLNCTLRIMLPKLKMIWKGEQVIVSKLVSDHHRKQREKDYRMNKNLDTPDIMHNVTGMNEIPNLSFYNRSFGASAMSLNYQSLPSVQYHPDRPTLISVASESLLNSSSQSGRPSQLFPQVSTGDMTARISNMLESEEAVEDNDKDTEDKTGERGAPSKGSSQVEEVDANKHSKNTASTDMDESMELEEIITRRQSTKKKVSPRRAYSQDSKRPEAIAIKTTPETKSTLDLATDSDVETTGSTKPSRRHRWSPLINTMSTFHLPESKAHDKNKPGGGRFRRPHVSDKSLENQSAKLTPRQRRASQLPIQGKMPKRGSGATGESAGLGTKVPPERMKVAPDETPARRLVLKMVDLQEQLGAVTYKIMSGLVVAPEDWDLLTSLNEKLHTTFARDVDFTWREPPEPTVTPKISSPTSDVSFEIDRKEPNFDKPSTQIAPSPKSGRLSPQGSPKRQRNKLKRGSVANPAEIAVAFRNIVDVRDRRQSIFKHRDCFVGKEAVDSLVYSGLASSREEAVNIGRAMVKDLHLFKNVNGDLEFADDDRLYRFVDLDEFWSSSEEDDEPDSVHISSILEEGPTLWDKALAFRDVVESKDITYRMQTHKNVFVGAEAVDSLVYSGIAATRWEAVQLGRKLARDYRLFSHVADERDFTDDYLFYKFNETALTSKSNRQSFELNSIAENSRVTGSKEASRNDLAMKADAFRMYVDARDRRYRLQLLRDVFVGSEAVDSIVFAGVASSRTEAVELGRTLMKELRLFTSVKGDDKFSDKQHAFYRFNNGNPKRQSTDGPNAKSKIADEATLKELRNLAEVFQQVVEVKDRNFRFRKYKRCFVGAEAVDAMVSNGMAESRVEAVLLGRAMERELELFKHVCDDKLFSDDYLFFQFMDPDLSSGSKDLDGARAMNITQRPSEHTKKYILQGFKNELLNKSDSSGESFAQWHNSMRSGTSNRSTGIPGTELEGANDSGLGASLGRLLGLGEGKSDELVVDSKR